MTVDFDLGKLDIGAVCRPSQSFDGIAAPLNDVFGDALDENLAYEFGFGQLGARGEPWSVECVRQRKVLFGNDSTGYSLATSSASSRRLYMKGTPAGLTERRMV